MFQPLKKTTQNEDFCVSMQNRTKIQAKRAVLVNPECECPVHTRTIQQVNYSGMLLLPLCCEFAQILVVFGC